MKINPFFKLLFIVFLCLCSYTAPAQNAYKVHSHNDYEQDYPFWKAYVHGAASIEIDIFLKEGQLLVAHTEEEINPERSIQRLYLDPVSDLIRKSELNGLVLLIDLKSEAVPTLDKLLDILKDYPDLREHSALRFVISGNRPPIETYSSYPDYIEFDLQNLIRLPEADLSKVGLISQNFRDYSVWNGLGRLTAEDLDKIEKTIALAKKAGKPVRFWGSPDTRTAWSTFAELGVDYINTDRPVEAITHLKTLEARTYQEPQWVPVYKPSHDYPQDVKPKNLILMIGDGNGLNQISAGMVANGGDLSLTQLKHLGLIKTGSYDDLVTDSAAGATAMASGRKTNNRAIGTDPEGNDLKSLTDVFSDQGFINGILTTDKITGATPAAFYAHVVERDDSETILEDLKQSKVDFFVSAGPKVHDKISSTFKGKELSELGDLSERTAAYLSRENRDFPLHVKEVLQYLENQSEPYFLMIENGNIDGNGHANNVPGIVQEVLEFDKVVSEVLRVADKNKNTLVVITADHETGGFGILQGEKGSNKIEGDFLTNDHTGGMVPVFSYGPRSKYFIGVYENTKIFDKILEVMEVSR